MNVTKFCCLIKNLPILWMDEEKSTARLECIRVNLKKQESRKKSEKNIKEYIQNIIISINQTKQVQTASKMYL